MSMGMRASSDTSRRFEHACSVGLSVFLVALLSAGALGPLLRSHARGFAYGEPAPANGSASEATASAGPRMPPVPAHRTPPPRFQVQDAAADSPAEPGRGLAPVASPAAGEQSGRALVDLGSDGVGRAVRRYLSAASRTRGQPLLG